VTCQCLSCSRFACASHVFVFVIEQAREVAEEAHRSFARLIA
jgi:hypothetical protein